MVAISTLLLAANLLALILNGVGFMSFWWNLAAYAIELGVYFILFILMALVASR